MNLTDADVLKFMRGSPVLLDDICAVYPATLGQIVDEGFDKFQTYLGVLTTSKPAITKTEDNELAQLIADLSNFEYLLLMVRMDRQVNATVKSAFRFFTHQEVVFSLNPAQIIVGPIEEQHIINEEKFQELQHLLKRMYFLEMAGEEIIIYDDDDPRVKSMKLKMIENREKVRRAKAKKAAQEGSDMQFSDLIGSLTLNNCGLNISNVWDITYYAFHDQLKRMGWRDQFNINHDAALAGAKINKSQLKHWMRSIASNSDKS